MTKVYRYSRQNGTPPVTAPTGSHAAAPVERQVPAAPVSPAAGTGVAAATVTVSPGSVVMVTLPARYADNGGWLGLYQAGDATDPYVRMQYPPDRVRIGLLPLRCRTRVAFTASGSCSTIRRLSRRAVK